MSDNELRLYGKRRHRGVERLPASIRKRIDFTPTGRRRSEKRKLWLYRFAETGDAAQSARDAGYPLKYAQVIGSKLKAEFMNSGLILDLARAVGVMEVPAMLEVLRTVALAYDPNATVEMEQSMRDGSVKRWVGADPVKASSQQASASAKAAAEYLDRLGMPRETSVNLRDEGDGGSSEDFREMLVQMLKGLGTDAVVQIPWVMERRDYRDFVLEQIERGAVKPPTIDVTPLLDSGGGDEGGGS